MDIRRPFPEDPERFQLFFGTFDDDNVPEEDTYLPLIEKSEFCAPCHFASFWGVVVYNSFGEWLDSPYSDPETGQTCQDCHMPAPAMLNGIPMENVAPGSGGVDRDPLTIHAHTQPGAASTELLQDTAELTISAKRLQNAIHVEVRVYNAAAGHHIPTDSPLRNILLVVEAEDSRGQPLVLTDGPTLPAWAGDLAAKPGRAYAKILEEQWTEISPTGAYWNPVRLLSDTRIPAMAEDRCNYVFVTEQETTITARLWFRRAFFELMQQKQWDIPDILMEEVYILMPAQGAGDEMQIQASSALGD
jgi:hypothetical protein